jgi:hypothetical protein
MNRFDSNDAVILAEMMAAVRLEMGAGAQPLKPSPRQRPPPALLRPFARGILPRRPPRREEEAAEARTGRFRQAPRRATARSPEVVARVSGAVEALAEALGEMANNADPAFTVA